MAGKALDRLHLDGGAKPKLKERNRIVTDEQLEVFFETLAASCNVKYSAKAAGISPQSCYTRRQQDAAFRQRWAEALAEGYAKLEMALLERALVGSEKTTTYRDGSTSVVREYPNALAMNLLKMHRDTVREVEEVSFEEAEVQETRERIIAKLDRIALRVEKQGKPNR